MTAAYSIAIVEGEDLTLALTWKVDGSPVDLTSATASFIIDGASGDLLTVADTDVSPDPTLAVGDADGTIAVFIGHAALQAAIVGQGGGLRYRLMVTLAGVTKCLLAGSLSVSD